MVSQIGDKFHMLAAAFMVLKTTGSPARMGLVLFCSIFPNMLLGFIAGAFIDRYNRKAIIVGADVVRGLIVSVLCILYYLGDLSFPVLLAAQVLISVCTAFFDPAVPAIIPQIVSEEQLTRANSQTQLVDGVATVIGPVLGGFTVAWAGYLPVFAINAASYLVSAAFECFIRLPESGVKKLNQSKISSDVIEGFRYVFQRRGLVLIIIIVGVIHFFVGSIETVIPVLADSLKGSGSENMGLIQTFLGFGIILGALFISIGNINGREALFLFGGVFFIGLFLVLTSLVYISGARLVTPFLFLFFAVGCAIITAGTSFKSILQKDVDESMMGRVFGLVSSVGDISIPLAMLMVGVLMEYVPHYLVTAACGLILAPVSILSYRRYMKASSGRGKADVPVIQFPAEILHGKSTEGS